MVKSRTREAPRDAKIVEKCSEVACYDKPIIEIVAWDGITLNTHLFLCRKHWEERCGEKDSPYWSQTHSKTRMIKFVKDLRSYL